MDKRPVVFLGTPPAAVTVLDALIDAGHEIVLVVSRADARRGRGGAVSASPVKSRALQLGLPVTDDLDTLRTAELPAGVVGVVVAYGRIIPASILDRMEMLNVHFSLLPRWRGAAPVERAILAGDAETGVCIMRMEEGLDTGPVYLREVTPINDDDTTTSLTERLASMGARAMCRVLDGQHGSPLPQGGQDTYARKIDPKEAEIDWGADARSVLRLVRAVNAWTLCDGRRVRVLGAGPAEGTLTAGEMAIDGRVGTGDGCVRLLRVQPEGKKAMDAQDWLRGRKEEGTVLLGGAS